MNSILILFLPFITVFSSPSPSETLDKLIPQLIGRTEQLSNLTYDEYKFVFSPSYFKTPLIKNMTKENIVILPSMVGIPLLLIRFSMISRIKQIKTVIFHLKS